MKIKKCAVHGVVDSGRSTCPECGSRLVVGRSVGGFRFADKELSGILPLKGTLKGSVAVVFCSGTSIRDVDVNILSPYKLVKVAVNEGIVKLGSLADYWVLSDEPIVRGYAKKCPDNVTILAMHQATLSIESVCKKNRVYTVNSKLESKDFDNGYEFFSRGTVLIGAIEMLRFMGVRRIYVFGCDCYRTEGNDGYYFDGRKHPMASELKCMPSELVSRKLVPSGRRLYVTSRLKLMIKKLNEAAASGLWDEMEIFSVGSLEGQQEAFPKIAVEDFIEHLETEDGLDVKPRRRKRRKEASDEDRSGNFDNGLGDSGGQEASGLDAGESSRIEQESKTEEGGGDRNASREDDSDGC